MSTTITGVIQTYVGSEMAVKRAIEIMKDNGIEEQLKEIVVPIKDAIEFKNGKEKISTVCILVCFCTSKI